GRGARQDRRSQTGLRAHRLVGRKRLVSDLPATRPRCFPSGVLCSIGWLGRSRKGWMFGPVRHVASRSPRRVAFEVIVSMGELRKPLFFAAVALIILVVLVEIGSSFLTRLGKLSGQEVGNLESMKADLKEAGLDDKQVQDTLKSLTSGSRPPGLAIPQMALL